MGITNFETQEDLDNEFERIEDLNFQHLSLKENVVEKESSLEYAEKELRDFEEENKEYLVG